MDEFYQITEQGMLAGMEANIHDGQPGIQDPRKILSIEHTEHYNVEGIVPHDCRTPAKLDWRE
ncbi:MAG: hypothetical protein Q8O89_02015 [Nanoarchaeota archaeon]|nr:hypothetical protein [Nanoarchaeota archaeon]